MLIVQVSHRINPIYDTVVYDSAHKELRITIFFLGDETSAGADHIFTIFVSHSIFYIMILFAPRKYLCNILFKYCSVIWMYKLLPHFLCIIYVLPRKPKVIHRTCRPFCNIRIEIIHKYIISECCSCKGIKYPVCLSKIPVMRDSILCSSYSYIRLILHALAPLDLRMLRIESLLILIHQSFGFVHYLVYGISLSLPDCAERNRSLLLLINYLFISGDH